MMYDRKDWSSICLQFSFSNSSFTFLHFLITLHCDRGFHVIFVPCQWHIRSVLSWTFLQLIALSLESADRFSTLFFPTFTFTFVVLYPWNHHLILLYQDVYPFHIKNFSQVLNFWKATDICPTNAPSLCCGTKQKQCKAGGSEQV